MKKLLICTLLGASLAACADAPTRLVGPDGARRGQTGAYGSENASQPEFAADGNGGWMGSGSLEPGTSENGGALGSGGLLPAPVEEIGTAGSGHAVHGGTRRGMQGRKMGEETTSSVVAGPVIAADGTCQTGSEIGTAGSGHIVLVPCT